MGKYLFTQSKLPPLNSMFGRKLARTLWDLKMYYHDARKEQDRFVRECDDAYLCRRFIPDTGAAELIEDGEFGESDLHDITNLISIRLALALMPRRDVWLTASTLQGDAPGLTDAIQDVNIMLHKKARTRRQVQRFIKQGIVRGTTHIMYDWDEEYRYGVIPKKDKQKAINEFLDAQGIEASKQEIRRWTGGLQKELIYSGPRVQPVDYFDVWYEPLADIVNRRRPSFIHQTFRSLESLRREIDDNEQPIYTNLDDLTPHDLEDIYNNDELAGGRRGSLRLFGTSIQRDSKIKLVPVYMIYLPEFELDGYKFFDTIFYIALSRKGDRARLIRIEQNPSPRMHMLTDHYIDWFVQAPYGISGLQFQLSKYHQKNFIQLLAVTAMAHSILPANLVYQEAFKDDEELNFGAGAEIPVMPNSLGLDVIKPLTVASQGAQQGEQFLRFYADELKASTGVDGMTTDNQARTLTKPKTATEINRDSTGGSVFLDNQAENLTDILNDLVQGVWELAQNRMNPDQDGYIAYEKFEAAKLKQERLQYKDMLDPRSIQVTGVNGKLNKEQETQNLLQFYNTLAQTPDPQVGPVKMWATQELANKLGIQIPPELLQNPTQLVSTNPAVQEAAFGQAMQNPQILEHFKQMVLQGQGQPQNGSTQAAPPGHGAPPNNGGAPQQGQGFPGGQRIPPH